MIMAPLVLWISFILKAIYVLTKTFIISFLRIILAIRVSFCHSRAGCGRPQEELAANPLLIALNFLRIMDLRLRGDDNTNNNSIL